MADEPTFETFEEVPVDESEAAVPADVDDDLAPLALSELPDIKLFGRWSCDDVHVSDMSLAVSCNWSYSLNTTINNFNMTFLGLHCC